MKTQIAVVGAGVIGRMAAWRLAKLGVSVSLFDQADTGTAGRCSAAAAGMLAPLAEAHHAGQAITAAGIAALALWPRLLEELERQPLFALSGSWVIALPGDEAELADFIKKLAVFAPTESWHVHSSAHIDKEEPALSKLSGDILKLSQEGFIDTEHALALILLAAERNGVRCYWHEHITQLKAHQITTSEKTYAFDWVIDTRGLGASCDLRDLRGVRGELVHVHAPELALQRPVRILHPRYPLYVVPRPDNHYVIGATQIESASEAFVSVRSTLELLTAAYAFHPALRQAGVTRLVAQVRPAFFDNQPRLRHKSGLMAVNGLFRHGWLLAPIFAEAVCALVQGQSVDAYAQKFVEEWL